MNTIVAFEIMTPSAYEVVRLSWMCAPNALPHACKLLLLLLQAHLLIAIRLPSSRATMGRDVCIAWAGEWVVYVCVCWRGETNKLLSISINRHKTCHVKRFSVAKCNAHVVIYLF